LFWKPKQHSTIQLLYKPTLHKQYSTIPFALETKHKTHTHTHTQQHNNTQKQKKSQKESKNSKSTNPKENVLFNTDFQSTPTTTMKFQQQQQI
jgi:hypothetical protein